MASHTEQLIVNSRESAPKYFIGRLARFFHDFAEGREKKRLDLICPNASLDFHIRGEEKEEETVSYDLSAIAVHSGTTIHLGHYYTYIRQRIGQEWKFVKYCDIAGPEICLDEKSVMQDAIRNGYIYYYKKREASDLPPPLLPFEQAIEELAPQEAPSALPEGGFPLTLADEMEIEGILPAFDLVPMISDKEIDAILQKNDAASLANQEGEKMGKRGEAAEWLKKNLSTEYVMQEQGFPSIADYAKFFGEENAGSEEQALRFVSGLLTCPVYLLDPTRDRELCVLDGNYPIPGDKFRVGEEFLEANPLYLFRQRDGSVVVILKNAG
jgi:hypothetical protein